MHRSATFGSIILALCISACSSDDDGAQPGAGTGNDAGKQDGDQSFDPEAPIACEGETYCPADMWLCRPGTTNNICRETQTATVYAPDGTTTQETLPKASKPKIDCFYVYPTVALSGGVGNVPDFSNIEDIKVPLRAQGEPFSEVCEVYAPLYHQTTFATFGSPDVEKYQTIAYKEVEAAFDFYLNHYNHGRKFVLLGHSQGSMMLLRLLQQRFDADAELRSRLLLAMPIGPVGSIKVPVGQTKGGSFQNLPVCTTKGETGCVVAFDSYTPEGTNNLAPPSPEAACVNPVNLGGDAARLKKSYFPTKKYAGQFSPPNNVDLPTMFTAFPNLFSGQCVRDTQGVGFRVSFAPEAGDQRTNPIDFKAQLFHILDYSFALADLVDLVRERVPSE